MNFSLSPTRSQLPHFLFWQLLEILFRDYFSAGLFLQRFACIAGYRAAFFCDLFVFIESPHIFISCNFCGRGFAEHGKDQFEVSHVITQIITRLRQIFVFLIFSGRQVECRSADFSSQNANSRLSFTSLFCHSFVSSSRTAMPRILFSIHASL